MTRPTDSPNPPTETDAPLRDYLRAKQDVVDAFRDLQRAVGRVTPWAAGRVDDLVKRLAEDRFQLVVLGQFKRGKTSLMNAIVGQAILPTGTIPVTSAVTSLRFGPTLRARVKRAGFPTMEVPLDQLPAYITERGNPGNHKRVLSATVDVPTPFLRRGLHFIDTPGIGSAHEHNTAATLAFLPEADAAILVTGADAPLSDAELTFLDAVRQHVRKLFFVLNKVDQITDVEREEVESYTTQLLTRRLGVPAVNLFPVSAAEALAAGADAARRERSGLPALEAALAAFLNDERRLVFLVALLDRAIAVVDEACYLLGIRVRALADEATGASPAEVTARWHDAELARRAAVAQIAGRFEGWAESVLDTSLREFTDAAQRELEAALPAAVAAGGAGDTGGSAGDWLIAELRARGEAWLAAIAARVDATVQQAIEEASPGIRRALGDVERAVTSRYGHGAPTAEVAGSGWRWIPPPFALPDGPWDMREAPALDARRHAWLPRAVDERRLVRSLTRALPGEAARVATALRGIVRGHLEACVVGIDVASASQFAAERRRFEQVFAPVAADATPAPAGGDDAGELQALRGRLVSLREALLGHVTPAGIAATADEEPSPAADVAASRPQPAAADLRSDTCPVCTAASDAVFALLCHHQFAINTSAAARKAFLAARGLCARHTWHLERVTSPRGLSLAYPPLLDAVAERLDAMAGLPGEGVAHRFHELLSHDHSCPACAAQREAEHAAAGRLVEGLRRAEGRAEFERALGLCLPHLRLVVAALDEASAGWLLRVHARRLVELGEAMRDYALKHDAGRRSQLTEDQLHAYRRALVLLAGERYLHRTELEE